MITSLNSSIGNRAIAILISDIRCFRKSDQPFSEIICLEIMNTIQHVKIENAIDVDGLTFENIEKRKSISNS